jgi:hypothetical protein
MRGAKNVIGRREEVLAFVMVLLRHSSDLVPSCLLSIATRVPLVPSFVCFRFLCCILCSGFLERASQSRKAKERHESEKKKPETTQITRTARQHHHSNILLSIFCMPVTCMC